MTLTLLPAVDVAGGQAVRLVQGAAGSETSYGDPLQAALAWQEAGAQWIHLVDLDAAFGRGSNAGLLADVVGRLDVAVELSGGIRDDASLAAALTTGCARVNIGTAALERPEWVRAVIGEFGEKVAVGLDVRGDRLAAALATGCARVNIGTAALERPEWVRAVIGEFGEKVAVGLDVRGDRLAARGWTQEGGDLGETLARLDADGCSRFVVTDVTRDGTLTGPNLDLLRRVCAGTGRPVIASGGVASLADLRAIATLAPIGVEGAIVGKALYAGAFTLEGALAAVAR
jgi:phosphoribosylformimino-5-aminoimidazole carboxamide ribonucleotide (ProFAR) isomerase